MIIKAKLPPGKFPEPSGIARTQPAVEPHNAVLTDESSTLFRLFFSAVSHEVANSLQGLRTLDDDPISGCCEHYTRDIVLSFNRLKSLGDLSPAMDGERLTGELALLYPDEFIDADHLDSKGKTALILGLKIRSLADLRSSLIEAGPVFEAMASDESTRENLDRALTYGKMLCNALDKIIRGNFDLSSEIVPQRVLGKSSVLRALISTAREAGVEINLSEIDASLYGSRVLSNPLFLRLIVANVFANAKRATESTKDDRTVSIFINGEAGKVCVRFVDCGCGMDAKTMDKLNSGIQTTTKKGSGHGIGFSYCRSLAEKLGGRLYVEQSDPSLGTIVALELTITD
jgi:signal transduction histidine kinase